MGRCNPGEMERKITCNRDLFPKVVWNSGKKRRQFQDKKGHPEIKTTRRTVWRWNNGTNMSNQIANSVCPIAFQDARKTTTSTPKVDGLKWNLPQDFEKILLFWVKLGTLKAPGGAYFTKNKFNFVSKTSCRKRKELRKNRFLNETGLETGLPKTILRPCPLNLDI